MTPVKPTWVSNKGPNGKVTSSLISWALKAGDVGDWIETFGPVCIQVVGDFGVNGRCLLEGSHSQDAEPVTLVDPSGHSSIGSAGMIALPLPPRFVRPVVQGGDSKTLLHILVTVTQ